MTPATLARISAGLTLQGAAWRARINPTYLHRIERQGGAPYVLALRLASLYECPIDVFL